MISHTRLQRGQLVFIATHQIQHVLGRAHRAFNPAQRVPAQQLLHTFDGHQHLISGRRETFAQRRGLRCHVMRPARHHQGLVLPRARPYSRHHCHGLIAHQLQRTAYLQLLHILCEIAAGHALVNMLIASQGVELLDAGLHIMAGHPLPLRDRRQIHVVDHVLVGSDCLHRNIHPEILLGFHHGNPQLALHDDFRLRTPQFRQFRRGIAIGQYVCDFLLFSHVAHYRMAF